MKRGFLVIVMLLLLVSSSFVVAQQENKGFFSRFFSGFWVTPEPQQVQDPFAQQGWQVAVCAEGTVESCYTLGYQQGTRECRNGVWSACTSTATSQEICNGRDDDSNGVIDDLSVAANNQVCGVGGTCLQGKCTACEGYAANCQVCAGPDSVYDEKTKSCKRLKNAIVPYVPEFGNLKYPTWGDDQFCGELQCDGQRTIKSQGYLSAYDQSGKRYISCWELKDSHKYLTYGAKWFCFDMQKNILTCRKAVSRGKCSDLAFLGVERIASGYQQSIMAQVGGDSRNYGDFS